MRHALSLAAGVVAISVLACRSEPAATAEPTTLRAAPTIAAHACPMSVPGTTAHVSDVNGGVALELVTTGTAADVTELRRRGRVMATQGSLGSMSGPGGGVGSAGRGRRLEASARVGAEVTRIEDIPNGVRVVVLPYDPVRVDPVRARARAHVARMGSNPNCMSAASR